MGPFGCHKELVQQIPERRVQVVREPGITSDRLFAESADLSLLLTIR